MEQSKGIGIVFQQSIYVRRATKALRNFISIQRNGGRSKMEKYTRKSVVRAVANHTYSY